MNESLINLLKSMISIPSISGDEKAVCDLLEQFLLDQGLTVHRRANNLWTESEPSSSSKPTILLNAHIDTVKPANGYTRDPFTPHQDGDIIYGLGSNDDGASVIATLAAFMNYCSTGTSNGEALLPIEGEMPEGQRGSAPSRLVWSATAEEENSGPNGIELILSDIGPVDLGIFGEPTGMQMAVAEKGLLVLDCYAHGKAGHAARNEGENALYKALDDINWIRNHHFERVSDFLGEVKMTVTMMDCGTQHNVVPDTCHFVVDVRPNGLYTNEEIVQVISQHIGSEVKPRSLRHESSSISTEHPIVQRAKAMGIKLFGSPTMSNQSLVTFPSVKIGPGDSARSHTADEFIKLSEIEEAINIYTKLLI